MSIGAKFFDPKGILCPITTFSKILFQENCSNNFEWDSLLPVEILKKCESWLIKLPLSLEIRIPRYLFSDILPGTKIELHEFCDSSTQSRVFDSSSQRYKYRIVAAKSKVAPFKQLTIPRLVLSGCLLLSKLISNIFSTLTKCHLITYINCWTDSTVALNWIKNISKTREKCVENRLTINNNTKFSQRKLLVLCTNSDQSCRYSKTLLRPNNIIIKSVMVEWAILFRKLKK